MNLFQAELSEFLQQGAKKRLESEGIDTSADDRFLRFERNLKAALAPTSADAPFPLFEILENYQNIFTNRGPQHIENQLIAGFSEEEYRKLGLIKMYPKMCRGLPRIYKKGRPFESHIKKSFAHLPTLRRAFIEKALYSLYDSVPIDFPAKITLFTWVMADGLGDYMAAIEAANILQKRFSRLNIAVVALVSEEAKISPTKDFAIHLIRYEKKCPLELITKEALQQMRSSDLILQMPTFYPQTAELMELLQQMEGEAPCPKMEILGEYGFIESSWFHPRTENRSMGLHFLEKGVMVREKKEGSLLDLQNEKLKEILFNTSKPTLETVENYLDTHHLYLAYLNTVSGGALYLHALLKSEEKKATPIDICTPDIKWFIEHVQRQNALKRSVFEFDVKVDSIEVYFQDQIYALPVGTGTKKVRIICPGGLVPSDFQILLKESSEFVGVRGNQSFSDAISYQKVFFYDGREHVRYFFKDLLALAENRLSSHPKALVCFRGMAKVFFSNKEEDEGEWVDEMAFQEKEDWVKVALEMGKALQDPDSIAGCKKLSKTIAEEFSCNDFLCHMIQRAVFHRKWPHIQEIEKSQLALFISGVISFSLLIKEIRVAILRKTL